MVTLIALATLDDICSIWLEGFQLMLVLLGIPRYRSSSFTASRMASMATKNVIGLLQIRPSWPGVPDGGKQRPGRTGPGNRRFRLRGPWSAILMLWISLAELLFSSITR